jgi:hypothetical protein
MDERKFDGKTYYAWGEYVTKRRANEEAERMRWNGHKARLVARKTGYQVYCDSKLGVMGQ